MTETRICPVSGRSFVIDDVDRAFYERISPTVGNHRLTIPPPTLAPEERLRRRLAIRNERFLYRAKCAKTGNPIVSAYSPDKDLKVVSRDTWLSLDNRELGREFDFSRPFFDQFAELTRRTWKANVIQGGEMENSEYTHFTGWLKNCYWMFDTGKSEDCLYGLLAIYCRSCIDTAYVFQSELCYEGLKLQDCYNVLFSSYSKNCTFSAYLHDCIGCRHCLCCMNLRNKEYYIGNEYVGRERFEAAWTTLFSGSRQAQHEMAVRFRRLWLSVPHRATRNIDVERCLGDELLRCHNVLNSFSCTEARDCRYVNDLYGATNDCYDVSTFGEGMQFCYETSGSGGARGKSEVSNLFFSNYIFYGGFQIFYSTHCHENCQHLFGCSDLRRAQFCILNKQYSQTDYEKLVPRIVEHMRETGEWGEFFPMHLALVGYNESLAQEFLPLERSAVENLGGWWSRYVAPAPDVQHTLRPDELPDKLNDTPPEITKRAIHCERTGRPFRIVEMELRGYRHHSLPLPRLHPDERYRDRVARLNPRALFERECAECATKLWSSFAPTREEHILCEACFARNTD